MIKKIYLSAFVFFLLSTKVQGKQASQDTLDNNCERYHFNNEKVDLKINGSSDINILFQIKRWEIETLYTFKKKCDKNVPVIFEDSLHTIVQKAIDQQIKPKSIWDTVFIEVTSFKIQKHKIPSPNIKLLFAIEFTNSENVKLHSRTYSFQPSNSWEKLIGKFMGNAIEEFVKNELYAKEIPFIEENDRQTPEGMLARGIYTSHQELIKNSPNINLLSNISIVKEEGINQYFLDDLDKNEKVNKEWIYAFSSSNFLFLNIEHYNPYQHFTRLERLNDNYFIGLDKVVDEAQAVTNTMIYGGGLLGASMGYSAATAKSCIIYHFKTGNIRAYSNKEIKNLYENNKEQYNVFKRAMKDEDIKALKLFMSDLYKDGETNSILMENK